MIFGMFFASIKPIARAPPIINHRHFSRSDTLVSKLDFNDLISSNSP